MRRGDWARHPLLSGEGDTDVVRVALLESIGMPRRTVSRKCGPSGTWRALLPGVVLLGNGEPTEEQRIRAALLHGPDGAMVTGTHALRRYGLARVPAPDEWHLRLRTVS